HDKNKKYYDAKHRPISYEKDELVWLRNRVLSNKEEGITRKFTKKWIGPFKIFNKVTEVTYELVTPEGKPIGKRHVSDLKPYICRTMEEFQNSKNFKTYPNTGKNTSIRNLRPRRSVN